jgi:uncharacterized protein YndB with AHSA1/START domain
MAARSEAAVQDAERTLVITRIFDAPRPLVWRAWTDPDHMVRWFGPKGFSGQVLAMDARVGGSYHFYMRGPQNDDHWLVGQYREILEPERLCYTYAWADAQGRPTRPETVLTLTFEEQGNKTKFTLHQALFESVTARDLHQGGWSSSLERLAEYLAAAK